MSGLSGIFKYPIPTDMTIEEAYKFLEADYSATEDQLKKNFHELSLKNHPDLNEQNTDEFQKLLNEAYDVAVTSCKTRSSNLISLAVENSLSQLNRNYELIHYRGEADSFIKKIYTTKIARTRPVSYMLWLCTAILGIVAFFGKEIFPTLTVSPTMQNNAKLFTAIIGLSALIFQFLRDNIKNRIETISSELQDKKVAALELSKLLNFKNLETFDSTSLVIGNEDSEAPTSTMFFGLNANERVKLIVLKSKEHGLIEPVKSSFLTPNSMDLYIIKFKPAEFIVLNTSLRQEIIRTEKDIINDTRIGLVLFTVGFISTVLIIYFLKSYWAILSGFFTIGGFILWLNSKSEFKDKLSDK